MTNYRIFLNASFFSIGGTLLPAAIAVVSIVLTAAHSVHAAGCAAVNFSISSRQVLHSNTNGSIGNDVTTADFNRDGNLDMAVTNIQLDRVDVFFGDGKGGFNGAALTTSGSPRRIFARDLNRDGRMDLLVSANSDLTNIFIGDANGGFTIGGTLPDGRSASAAADFNLDGKEDFVVKDGFSGDLRMYLGNGNGTFASPLPTDLSNNIGTAAAADFNRDGKPDLVLGAFGSGQTNQIFFLPGDGAGGFGTIVPFSNVNVSDIKNLAVGDVNGDGRLDLIVVGGITSKILLGAAAGVFTVSTVTLPVHIEDIQITDFNNDGKTDLLLYKDDSMEVRLGNGSGAFTAAPITTQMNASFATELTAADFNNDGKIDFAATDLNEVIVGLNRCGGLTNKPKIDFDGDGKTDAVVFRPSTGQWFALRSSDNSFFAFPFGVGTDVPASGDFDGDGKTDPAVFRPSTGQWFIFRSKDNGVSSIQFGQAGDKPAVGDYDGDGRSDVAVFRPSNGFWFVLRSADGGVTFIQWGVSTDIPIQ